MNLRNWFGTDELAVVRFCMRMMACWPENRTWWKDIISFLYPVSIIAYTFLVWWFFIFESWNEGIITVLQSFSDCLGESTIAVRAISIRRHAQEVYQVQKMIIRDFGPLEKKTGKVRIQRPLFVWFPCILFGFKCSVSCTLSLLSLLEPPDKRETSFRIPYWMINNDFRFFALTVYFVLWHWPVYFSNTTADALIISLSTLMCEKVETLKKIILDLKEYDNQLEIEEHLKKAIRYHILLGDLRNKTDAICGGSMLFQLLFIVVSLGSPGLRIIFAELKTEVLGFMLCYVLWISCELVLYCMVFDEATRKASKIEFYAYSVYDPALTRSVNQKLIVMMSRARQPLHFTANGLVKLNRKTLLEMYKRSYRFYSALFNLT